MFQNRLNNSSIRTTNPSIKIVGSSDRPATNLINTISDQIVPENQSDSDSEELVDEQHETASITLANLGLNKGT